MNEIEKQILTNQLIIMKMLRNMDNIYNCTKEIKQTEMLIRETYISNEKE